jgi:hypothetical protein
VRGGTVALGVAAAGAVAAAVVVTTGGHASAGSRERKAVVAYVDQVNALKNRMHVPLARVMLAYASFGKSGAARQPSAGRLRVASATLNRLDRRLTALDCPPEAATLRKRLLVLVHREAAITREVQLLAEFTPRYVSTLRGVHTASLTLDSALKSIVIPRARSLRGTKQAVAREQQAFDVLARRAAVAQADAIDAYDRAVGRVLRRLAPLQPPPALQPAYRAQIAALHAVTAAGADLAGRLRALHRSDITAFSRRFSLASRAADTLAAQRAQIAAIRSYNKRVRQVGAAAGAVQTELARLRRDLP